MAPWVSCNWPATAITFIDTGEDGREGAAAPHERRPLNAAIPAMPPRMVRRPNIVLVIGRYPSGLSEPLECARYMTDRCNATRIDLDHTPQAIDRSPRLRQAM